MDASMLLLYSLFLTSYSIGIVEETCDTPQYLVVGKSGTIECSFHEDFHTVLWYNSTDPSKGKALLQITDGVKEGPGYYSGEYDVCANGSLRISNVKLGHEQTFTVFLLKLQNDDHVSLQVEVIVTVKPSISFPFVDQCGEQNSICFKQLDFDSKLTCIVQNARPAVPLVWVDRTAGRDRNVSFQASVSRNGPVFATRATTMQVFPYSSLISLLSCKADVPPGLLVEKQTTILIENINLIFTDNTPIVRHVERGSQFLLPCSNKNISLIVWKRASQNNDTFEVLAYAALFEEGVVKVFLEQYDLQTDGSLLLPQVEAKHEGFYGCVFENEFSTGGSELYHVVVFSTAVPVVHGCTEDVYCVLEAQTNGSLRKLRCSLKGILPKVGLQWKTFHDRDASLISFTNQKLDVNSNGDVYDVLLTSTYQIQETAKDRVTLECRISETDIEVLHSATTFDLLFSGVDTTEESMASVRSFPLWILVISITMCLLAVLLCLFFIQSGWGRSQRRTMRRHEPGEDVPMILASDEEPPSVEKITLIKELKAKYKDQYDAVQPIPYIRDRLYCVDRVFVKGGFERLMSKGKIEGFGNWEKLNSYHEVLKSSSSSTRTIIEGDPGYGKSTLTLQLAYDWCNRTAESPLANVGILILLRLRQLGGVQSIFKAIKQFILPLDSTLSETDIATVMYESKSTVFILDGYDEYPEDDAHSITNIISIIRREMFQENLVILTTRPSFLPKSYPPQTQRIRLTGFDEKARDAYIRKAVVGNNPKAAKKIKRSLRNNSILQGLCQVPLFFVMFAHMTHESETFLKFSSVTNFFRYMITCFHSHMKNKLNDANVGHVTLLENDHKVLDNIAFDGLSGKNQQIVWEKGYLCKCLGNEFYDQYKRIGILVEEEVLDLEGKPGDIQYKVEVRFYHKLFCEWYAAHCLARKIVQPGVNFQKLLEHMNPFDLQYTYRFACGLNPDAGDKIIEYLRGIMDGDKFAVLCILEQTGKIDQIKDTIGEMCSNYMIIDNNDSMLLQGSTVQLLEIGAGNQMPISFVWLKDCFNSVDLSTGSILLKSELSIPALPTIHELAIGERDRELDNMEVSNILEYSLMCASLKILRFCHCILPQSVQARCLSSLQSNKVQVWWITVDCELCLNHRSGEWEEIDEGSFRKKEEFNIQAKKNLLISSMREYYKDLTRVVQPIPSDQESVYSFDHVFVDLGLEGLTYKDKNCTGRWEEIDSYQDIFRDSRSVGKRRLLEGRAGSGKSTIALQMAFDWCNDSTKSNSEMFFLVRLRQLGFLTSIYTQLKYSTLPKDSPLSGNDIKHVLQACSSALVVLDDFHFYADQMDSKESDIINIIQGKMFPNIDVIITSTGFPEACTGETIHLRLTGFNDKTRNEYIRKVVVADDVLAADRVKRTLQENTIINDFYKIPFYFVLFAHMSQHNKQMQAFTKDQNLLAYILDCFHCHLINKANNQDSLGVVALEKSNKVLGEFAFDNLYGNNKRKSKEEIIEKVGQTCYDYYTQMGILVEHNNVIDADGHGIRQGNQSIVQVKFYSKTFVEWYATHYMANNNVEWSSEKRKHAFKSSPYLQNVCQSEESWIDFAVLWIFDQRTYVSGILDVVKRLCSENITFKCEQKESLHQAMIHVLQIASRYKISISHVYLFNCYSTVYLSGGYHLQLKSNLSIPVLTTLKTIAIRDDGREITAEEFTDILQYSSKCLALKKLVFYGCLLPQSVQAESVSILRSRNVTVRWWTTNCCYRLNLESRHWARFDPYTRSVIEVMTEDDYQRVVEYNRQLREPEK